MLYFQNTAVNIANAFSPLGCYLRYVNFTSLKNSNVTILFNFGKWFCHFLPHLTFFSHSRRPEIQKP